MPRREQPLQAGDDILVEFARDLRRLREEAGSPTYRELSGRAHYSAAALSEAANGRKLPSLAVTVAYVAACAGDVTQWERRWREAAAEIANTNGEAPDDEEAPYVGLAAFQVGDADRFFGREDLIKDLLRRVREHRFVGVFGASGCGKSSVLRAGLVARLTHDGVPTVVLTPGSHPIEECAVHLAASLRTSPALLRAEFAENPRNLHLHVRTAMANRAADQDLILVVDQFEEVFTLSGAAERTWLVKALTTAASAPTSRTRVVLGVRADFYGHCGQRPELVDALRDAQVLVGPMTENELQRAITEPAVRAGLRVETALVSQLVAASANQSGDLPLVSHVLLETWRRRRGTTLTLAGYEASGGIAHAVTRTAEDTHAGLDPDQRELAKQIFLRLVALGEGTEDTKRRISRRELDNDDPNTALVLDRLARARLVTLDQDSVDIAHESLIRRWPRLRDWLTANRDGHRIHRELTEATEIWESLSHDPGALYRGARLAIAHEWASTADSALTPREREFLDASRSAQAQEHLATRRRARRLRQLVALLTVLLLVAVGMTVFAVRAQQTATQQRNAALAQKVLREATAMRPTNPALAMQLALAAHRLDPTVATRSTLHEMFATPYAARLTGHISTVFGVAISPDGKTMVTATIDPQTGCRLWDISDPHRPRELPSLPVAASSAAFSPDGQMLAVAGSRGSELWDVSNRTRPQKFSVLGEVTNNFGIGTSVAFSPNGRILATMDASRRIRLWAITNPQVPEPLATLPGGERVGLGAGVVFSPDGHILAGTGAQEQVQLWKVTDPRQPQPLVTLTGHPGAVYAIAFDPDGRVLATAGRDTTTRLWNLSDPRHPEPLATMTGHTGTVSALAFAHDGNTLATASADRTTRLWNVTDRRRPLELAALTGHTDAVLTVAFTPDGNTLATAGSDRTARLQDVAALAFAGHDDAVRAVTFSPDSRTAATANLDGSCQLWDIADPIRPRKLASLRGSGYGTVSIAFRPDGRILATTDAIGTTWLWDVTDPRHPSNLATVPGTFATAVFSPDGHILAGLTLPDGQPQLWDVRDPHHPRESGAVPAAAGQRGELAFSPNGRILAVTGPAQPVQLWDVGDPHQSRKVGELPVRGLAMKFGPAGDILAITDVPGGDTRLWNVADPRWPEELTTIDGDIHEGSPLAIGPDGEFLVIAGEDRTAGVWDIADPRHPKEVAILRGHAANVLAVAVSPDGRTIATAGEDHTVRLWDTDVERVAARVCVVAWPRITEAEWGQYFSGLAYQPPC